MSKFGVVGEIVLADRSDMVSELTSEGTGVQGRMFSAFCLEADRMACLVWSRTITLASRARTDR